MCIYIYNGVYEVTKTTQEHHLLTKKPSTGSSPIPRPSAMYIFPKPFAANMATCSTRVQTRLLRELVSEGFWMTRKHMIISIQVSSLLNYYSHSLIVSYCYNFDYYISIINRMISQENNENDTKLNLVMMTFTMLLVTQNLAQNSCSATSGIPKIIKQSRFINIGH